MKKILFVLLMICSLSAFSQDTLNNSGKLNLSGMFMNVNGSSQSSYSYDFSHSLKYRYWDIGVSSNYILSYVDGQRNQDDKVFRLQPRLVDKDWSVFVFTQYTQAFSRKLDSRMETGLGGGHYIIKRDDWKVTGSYALLMDRSLYLDRSSINATRHSPRVQFFGTWKKLSLYFEEYYQPKIDDWSNYNSKSTSEIKYAINNKLSLVCSYKRSYETYTIKGTKNLNENFTIGTSITY